MTNLHRAALELLVPSRSERSWAKIFKRLDKRLAGRPALDPSLPLSLAEWQHLDPNGDLLTHFCHEGRFWFDRFETVEIGGVGPGLIFGSQTKGRIQFAIALTGDADPPVYRKASRDWHQYARSFSDHVFAQIFDVQYSIRFDPEMREWESFDPSSLREVVAPDALERLRRLYTEGPSTRLEPGDTPGEITEFRFWKDAERRIVVQVWHQDSVVLDVQARTRSQVHMFEAELLRLFEGQTRPNPLVNLPGTNLALEELGWRIDEERWDEIRADCEERPSDDAMARLIACHRETPLHIRTRDWLPDINGLVLGGPDWGVTIEFSPHKEDFMLVLKRIAVA